MISGPVLLAQDQGSLTSDEQQFKDSIEALNLDFETISKAKESYNRGIEFFKQSDYQDCINEFDQSVQLFPGFLNAYFNRGVAYLMLEKYRKAIIDFSTVV